MITLNCYCILTLLLVFKQHLLYIFLAWKYIGRRINRNPIFKKIKDIAKKAISKYVDGKINNAIKDMICTTLRGLCDLPKLFKDFANWVLSIDPVSMVVLSFTVKLNL